ncbi:sel1 repeat family protein [Acetobacteraceae bacterium]|nr:sel1 repeat family protein [Acetobacteraceae bacterium]
MRIRRFFILLFCLFLLDVRLDIGCALGMDLEELREKLRRDKEVQRKVNPYEAYDEGLRYYTGRGTPRDLLKSKHAFEQAEKSFIETLKLDNSLDQAKEEKKFLAQCYLMLGIIAASENKDKKAFHDFEKAAKENIGEAFYNLGLLYEQGRGTAQNYQKARQLYEQASQAHVTEASFSLGRLYENGWGVQQNYIEAKNHYEKASFENLPRAQFALGHLYENALGVTQDYSRAKDYYFKASEQDLGEAEYNLGLLYFEGKGGYKNLSLANEYFDKAEKHGFIRPQKKSKMRILEKSGKVEHKETALSQKDFMNLKTQNGDDLFQKGLNYQHGNGGEQNYTKAFQYFKKASQKGNLWADLNLGVMYEKGHGVAQNYQKAREYYESAAQQSLPEAENNLGYLYQHGLGMDHNYLMAKQYYEMASSQDNAEAFYNLGIMALNGQGCAQSKEKALDYFRKACRLSYEKACSFIKK